jgi:hypothetical protein
VYAWFWKYYPELEVYRALMWMEVPFQDATKCRFDKYIGVALATSKDHVLRLLDESLEREFLNDNSTKGLSRA